MMFQKPGLGIGSHLGLYALGAIAAGLTIGAFFQLPSLRLLIPAALFFRILGPVASFLVILLAGAFIFGRAARLKKEDSVGLSMSITPKNNAIFKILEIRVSWFRIRNEARTE